MSIPTTYGAAIQIPGASTSRRLPRLNVPSQLNVLGYEGLVYGFLPEDGMSSTSPLVVVDRIGGLTHAVNGTAPVVNRNASGDGRAGLVFDRTSAGYLTANFTMPASYHMVAVVNANDAEAGNVRTILAHENDAGDDILIWLKQDSAGDPLDINMRHGTGLTVDANQAVPLATRSIVQTYFDGPAGSGGIFVGNTLVAAGSMAPHTGATSINIGGQGASRGMEGTIEAVFVFDRALYSAFADGALNTYRTQFVTELSTHMGVTL